MIALIGMVSEFHEAAGIDLRGPERRAVAFTLVREETLELRDALKAGNRVSIAREVADLVYVATGAALSWGVNPDVALKAVHEANMAKRFPDGTFHRDETGKVLKPPGWVEPSMAPALTKATGYSIDWIPA